MKFSHTANCYNIFDSCKTETKEKLPLNSMQHFIKLSKRPSMENYVLWLIYFVISEIIKVNNKSKVTFNNKCSTIYLHLFSEKYILILRKTIFTSQKTIGMYPKFSLGILIFQMIKAKSQKSKDAWFCTNLSSQTQFFFKTWNFFIKFFTSTFLNKQQLFV